MADTPAPRTATVVTSLNGNGKSHTTDALAVKVTVHVLAPQEGNIKGRPTINSAPVAAGQGHPYVFEAERGWNVDPLTIETNAGSNDLVIIEEF